MCSVVCSRAHYTRSRGEASVDTLPQRTQPVRGNVYLEANAGLSKMGEDRTTCTEKKPNEIVVPPCRHRHSSVISSCSEDAESESTSAGYPPSPDEEREEELEYGPGIVNKLRTRFLSISLKQNRGTNMRRSCSMENLLDQDRPSRLNSTFPSEKSLGMNGVGRAGQKSSQSWGNLKRAKSMDTLLMELNPEPPPVKELRSELNGKDGKQPKIIKRQDGGLNRSVPTICDEELPKPDTVKTYKRMFEPAESRRGSHCRRPPVLRASAKACAASKMNGILSSPSAKVNGVQTKNKFSAKPISPVKAQLNPDTISPPNINVKKPVTNGEPIMNGKKPVMNGETVMNGKKPVMNGETVMNGKKPLMNGEPSRPLYNGCHVVKATPMKINSNINNNNNNNMRNGKDVEKNLNSINRLLSKKEVNFSPKTDIICNGNSNRKEILKSKTPEETVKQFNKIITTNGIDATNSKPKVPPNRPNPKSLKPPLKIEEKKSNEKIVPPKLKPNLVNGFKKTMEIDCNGLSKESNCKNDSKVNHESKSNNEIRSPPESKRVGDIQTPAENKLKDVVKLQTDGKTKELKVPPEIKPKIQKPVETVVKEENRPLLGNDVQKNNERTVSATSEPSKMDKPDKPLNVPDREIANAVHEIPKTEISKSVSPKKEMQDKDGKSEIKSVKKSQAGPATSMVFDFRGKDVVPHVAVLPVPFGCKAPKKRPIFVDGKEVPNGSGTLTDDDDDDYVDYSIPPPSGVVFEGENVKIGRGSILSTRNKELKIKFDDDVDSNTFIYPSETSLLEDSERSLSPPATTGNETNPNGQHPPKLKTNTVIGTSSAGGLSTYTPSVLRTMDNFEPGMFRPPPPSPVMPPEKEEEKDSEEEENVRESVQDPDMLKPADPGLISSWSLSAGTSDLLF